MSTQKRKPGLMHGPITALFAERAWQHKKDDPDGRRRIEAIVDTVLDDAEKGDTAAQRLAFEYIQGRPGQQLSEEQMLFALASVPLQRLQSLAKLAITAMPESERKLLKGANEDDGRTEE